MSDTTQANYPNWTDEQWSRISKVVVEEAQKARVAAKFLPLFGPVDPSLVAVPNLRLGNVPVPPYAPQKAQNRLFVDSSPETYLATISILVSLANHEAADPELSAALVAFRRAAVTIARIEDALIFNGQNARDLAPQPTFPGGWLAGLPRIFTVTGGARQPGLVPENVKPNLTPPPGAVLPRVSVPIEPLPPLPWVFPDRQSNLAAWGETIVSAIIAAIGSLEGNGHSGPFACFLSPDTYEAVHTPTDNLVLPRDRILPFLGGDYLQRSNTIPNGYGIVVALGGAPAEIVVASDISVVYLQQTGEPKYLFRVSEKIALRVKEWDAVAVLHPTREEPLAVEAGALDLAPAGASRPRSATSGDLIKQLDTAISSAKDARDKTETKYNKDIGKADGDKKAQLKSRRDREVAQYNKVISGIEEDKKKLEETLLTVPDVVD
jgi:uncharacterized linocin/CFP29 family protein